MLAISDGGNECGTEFGMFASCLCCGRGVGIINGPLRVETPIDDFADMLECPRADEFIAFLNAITRLDDSLRKIITVHYCEPFLVQLPQLIVQNFIELCDPNSTASWSGLLDINCPAF